MCGKIVSVLNCLDGVSKLLMDYALTANYHKQIERVGNVWLHSIKQIHRLLNRLDFKQLVFAEVTGSNPVEALIFSGFFPIV